VARALVVISDGEDNSSSDTLKQAIRSALRGEVAVYTVSTKDVLDEPDKNVVGERALTALAELSGGAAFSPGSIHNLNGSLAALQQVIRSRYLISYKPAFFQRDGKYHAIDLKAEKDGHELRVYARKGYYESTGSHNGPDRF
jgi:VWFA-related protein